MQRSSVRRIVPGILPFHIMLGHTFVALLLAKQKSPLVMLIYLFYIIFVSSFTIIYSVRRSRPSLLMSLFLTSVVPRYTFEADSHNWPRCSD